MVVEATVDDGRKRRCFGKKWFAVWVCIGQICSMILFLTMVFVPPSIIFPETGSNEKANTTSSLVQLQLPRLLLGGRGSKASTQQLIDDTTPSFFPTSSGPRSLLPESTSLRNISTFRHLVELKHPLLTSFLGFGPAVEANSFVFGAQASLFLDVLGDVVGGAAGPMIPLIVVAAWILWLTFAVLLINFFRSRMQDDAEDESAAASITNIFACCAGSCCTLLHWLILVAVVVSGLILVGAGPLIFMGFEEDFWSGFVLHGGGLHSTRQHISYDHSSSFFIDLPRPSNCSW